MELLILIISLILTVLLIVVKSFTYRPNSLSIFELERRAEQGDKKAWYEQRRRLLLPALVGLKIWKTALLTSALAVLLVTALGWWLGFGALVGLWLLSEFVVAKEWLAKPSRSLQRAGEPFFLQLATRLSALLQHFAPRHHEAPAFAVGSRAELLDIIDRDEHLLDPREKARMQHALKFGALKVSDAMVAREKIATVKASETVGPLLLDRLHKVGHRIFVVIKEDLDHIEGFLHMADATSGHPGIKKVADATRPLVHYISKDDTLESALAASLQSGRHMFIVVDNNGNTQGLITLRDVLAKLLGAVPPGQTRLSTNPKEIT